MAAGRGRSVRGVNETRPRRASGREVGSERPDDPRDDWLGDVSDDDWSAGPTETVPRPRPSVTEQGLAGEPVSRRPARTSGADRSAVARRRIIAGALLVGLVGVAGVVAAVLLRGDDSPTTPVTQPVAAPTTTQTTPSTSTEPTTPTTSTPTTTQPETGPATGFTLPEGTKLQRDAESDPALVRQLQQALTAAGYEPGPADGTYGEQTEAAVVAFQQANGLSVDGRVGPETAAALNSALATG
jgi:putative peptidoglycan binding protein